MEQGTRKLQPAAAPLTGVLPQGAGDGSALYVINLCASMTPIAQADKAIPGFENYRVYQVSRKEDGRVRYRLRLGFFTDEAEAETALTLIRDHYPTAFATSLSDDDQRHSRSFANGAAAKAKPAPKAEPTPAKRPAEARPATNPAANAAKPAAIEKPPVAASAPATPIAVKPAAKAASTSPAAKPAGKPVATNSSPSDTQRVRALEADSALEIEVEWQPATPTPATAQPKIEKAAATQAPPVPPSKVATVAQPAAAQSAVHPKVAAPTQAPAQAKADKPVVTPTQKAAATPVAPASTGASKLELTLEAEPVAPVTSATTAAPSAAPFHVGKGVEIPTSALSLALEPSAPVALTQTAATPAAKPAAPKTSPQPTTPQAKQPGATEAAKAPAVTPVIINQDLPLPALDSTQTIRALTAQEMDDATQPKWFAVQLAVSEQPINLDTMPSLDIFAAYRLYSVATAGSGKILHHMRIGFFKEHMSAEAVCGYLKTFFANPTALRISGAEYKRFSEGPPPQPSVEAKAKVIDITASRDRAPARDVPVVTMEVVNPSATGRFQKPTIEASGVHKKPAVTTASKTPVAAKSAARSKTSTSNSGKHKTLKQELLDEAREVELSESAIRRLPKNSSLLSKLFGKK